LTDASKIDIVKGMDAPPLSPLLFHILVALAGEDRHGYAIMQDVAARTEGQIRLGPGTLYGAVKKMLEDGWIVEVDSDSDRRRCYRLTKLGRKIAETEAYRLSEVVKQARANGLMPRKA
jgi:DNA-binding PadR family transcriptional regulator